MRSPPPRVSYSRQTVARAAHPLPPKPLTPPRPTCPACARHGRLLRRAPSAELRRSHPRATAISGLPTPLPAPATMLARAADATPPASRVTTSIVATVACRPAGCRPRRPPELEEALQHLSFFKNFGEILVRIFYNYWNVDSAFL
jgi:hypothetical protein